MAHETIEIRTEDGTCPTHVFRPDGTGRWPAVLRDVPGTARLGAVTPVHDEACTERHWRALFDFFGKTLA